jgi:hypothetical protein
MPFAVDGLDCLFFVESFRGSSGRLVSTHAGNALFDRVRLLTRYDYRVEARKPFQRFRFDRFHTPCMTATNVPVDDLSRHRLRRWAPDHIVENKFVAPIRLDPTCRLQDSEVTFGARTETSK